MIFAKKAAVKNWERIRRGEVNSYLQLSYKNAQDESLIWLSGIATTLAGNGLGDGFINNIETNTRQIPDILSQNLMDLFHQEAFSTINNENSKLRTYGLVKCSVGLENYLLKITNLKHRKTLRQIRLSSRRLVIESGRH